MPREAVPGSIYLNGNRYWWDVRLPGEEKHKARPLIPEGAKFATKDEGVAKEIARRLWQNAIFLAKAKESTGKDNTIAGLIHGYMDYARSYYRTPDGKAETKEVSTIELSLRPLVEACPTLPAEDFGPKKARQIRQTMMDGGRLCRPEINRRINIWRRMFKWAVSQERVSTHVLTALQTLEPLKQGRCGDVREPDDIQPVDPKHVEAILPYAAPPIAAMLRLQLLTGMRSGEVTIMRSCDIDTITVKNEGIWVYKPPHHKTQHHGHERPVYLGQAAQDILKPFMAGRKVDTYLFSPAEADQWRRAKLSAARVTPTNQGNKPGSNRKDRPEKKPGERYDTGAYGKAVTATIRRANEPRQKTNAEREAKGLQPEPLIPHFHPHQIRHTVATEVRKQHGLDAAQVLLGHATLEITQVYAEVNARKAIEVAKGRQLGVTDVARTA